jgi:hypothetical protein
LHESLAAAAALFESELYYRWGGLRRSLALILSFQANALSVITGCIMVF